MRSITSGMLANINKLTQATSTASAPFVRLVMGSKEIQNYIESGDVHYSIDNTIVDLALTLNNVNNLFDEIIPNKKLDLYLGLGSEEMYFRSFYVDRVSRNIPDATFTMTARNAIGKKLYDQSFGGNMAFTAPTMKANLEAVLTMAGITEYIVADSGPSWGISFTPDTNILDGIMKVISILPGWRVDENSEGKVVIAPANNPNFDQPGVYTFSRDKTCWSYDEEKDDSEAYGRIFLTCNNPSMQYAFNVNNNVDWNISPYKTLFVDVPDGTTSAEMEAYGNILASEYALSGSISTYAGIYSPQLLIGDTVVLNDNQYVGIVTEIKHNFGKDGFYTTFTVASAGRKGKVKFNDFFGSRDAKAAIGEGGEDIPSPVAPDNYLSAENIIAGENITIDRDGRNVTVSSTGGGGGDPLEFEKVKTITKLVDGFQLTLDDGNNTIVKYTEQAIVGGVKLTSSKGGTVTIYYEQEE